MFAIIWPQAGRTESTTPSARGALFAGVPGAWTQIPTPDGVLVSAVAVGAQHDGALYIGAANGLAIYRSLDAGENWLHVPLSDEIAAA